MKKEQNILRYNPLHSASVALMMLYDIIVANASYFFVLFLRYEGHLHYIYKAYWRSFLELVPVYSIIIIVVFYLFKMYHSVWKYAGFKECVRAFMGSTVASLIYSVVITVYIRVKWNEFYSNRMPLSYYAFGYALQLFAILLVRLASRFIYTENGMKKHNRSDDYVERVMLVGGGEAGMLIIRAMQRETVINERICCIIDDDKHKWGKFIEGVPVVGGRDDILLATKKYGIDKIYVAIPSANEEAKRQIMAICTETDCRIKNLPSMYLSFSGEITTAALRDVSIEDLLGREPVKPQLEGIAEFIQGKKILVTGGGGSIGSELCRQIASHNPAALIIFDIYENNAYDIQLELKKKYPELNLITLIGSVRDTARLDYVFSKYRPDVVYHAAAHKHVPLMEDSPCESIKNNVLGTYKTAYAAMVNGCKRFVLISTDKAVNPTNIMGASKRLCEMVVQTFDRKVKSGDTASLTKLFTHEMKRDENITIPQNVSTEFVAVRFGNVLGSNGSVVPVFKRQIAEGGPVTVTHPDIIRYFMTIPEAVSLVLLAGTYAKGGEIFVLDMGSPVKIDTLARNLIKLSGLKPDVDIKIEYSGLRPGEKLFEEKLMAEEGLRKTENKLIHIGNPIPFDEDKFCENLKHLMDAAYSNREDKIRDMVRESVVTYKPAENN